LLRAFFAGLQDCFAEFVQAHFSAGIVFDALIVA
jgi:hypothetical protein